MVAVILLSSGQGTSQEDIIVLGPYDTGTEVLLNDPRIVFDTSPLIGLWEEGYVKVPGAEPPADTLWFSDGPFLYLGHFNSDLGVEVRWENLTGLLEENGVRDHSLAGFSVSIVVPCTVELENHTPGGDIGFTPDMEMDIDSINWNRAMKEELEWLISIGVISGLDQAGIERISSLSDRGNMGPDHRVIFHHNTSSWELYDTTGLPGLPLLFGPPSLHTRSEFPDSVAPSPDGDEELLSTGLIILAAASFSVLAVLGSLFYYRTSRIVRINNARRKLIYELIRLNPGIHFSALMNDLDLKPGVTSYHINKLEKAELIKSYQDGMYRRFYLFEDRVEMKIALSDLQKIIVHTISEEPGISQIDISRAIGKSKVVINYHVRFLRDLGLLVMEKDGRETHCFLTPQGTQFSGA